MSRGDKAAAVGYLLEASNAPPTDYMRYGQIDMSLAQKLVYAGERGAVAKFLDRCATFNEAKRQLADWADDLRKGLNPELRPNFQMLISEPQWRGARRPVV
jgi:hypothetical protein